MHLTGWSWLSCVGWWEIGVVCCQKWKPDGKQVLPSTLRGQEQRPHILCGVYIRLASITEFFNFPFMEVPIITTLVDLYSLCEPECEILFYFS